MADFKVYFRQFSVNIDTPRQYLNYVWTDFWYSSSFSITWPSKLGCNESWPELIFTSSAQLFTDDVARRPVSVQPGGGKVHRLTGSTAGDRGGLLADGVGAAGPSRGDADCGDGGTTRQMSPVLATVWSVGQQTRTTDRFMYERGEKVFGNRTRVAA